VKRAILAVSVCLSISSSRALAVDWSVNASINETTELNNNQFLRSVNAAPTLGSYTTITADAVARTPTSRFNLDTNFTYTKYWGPGLDGIINPTTSNNVFAHYETFGKDPADRQYIDASWTRSNTQLAVLANLGVQTTAVGDLDTAAVKGGIERNLSALDSVALSVRSALSYYDPSNAGTQFLDTDLQATWNHRVTGLATLLLSSESEWLSYNNATQANLIILRNQAGIDITLSPLLSFRGKAGAAYLQASQQQGTLGAPSAVVLPGSTGGILNNSTSASVAGFIGDMSIIYRMLKSTTLNFTANHGVSVSIIGSLTESTAFAAGLSYSINQLSALSLGASATRQTTTGGTTDFLSGSVTYNRALAREWNSFISYRYLHRSASSGAVISFDPITGIPLGTGPTPASSNSIVLGISRNFAVLPPGT
jgi:hypothetical protein